MHCPNHSNQQNDRTIQNLKHQTLHRKLEQHELRIHQYEKLYDKAVARFQSETCNTFSSHHFDSLNEFTRYVKNYMRQHGCHRQSSRMNKTMDVYPRIIVDVPHVL